MNVKSGKHRTEAQSEAPEVCARSSFGLRHDQGRMSWLEEVFNLKKFISKIV